MKTLDRIHCNFTEEMGFPNRIHNIIAFDDLTREGYRLMTVDKVKPEETNLVVLLVV